MPGRRRRSAKGQSIVPHLANPTTKPRKPKRRKSVAYNYKDLPCCDTINNFMGSLMKNFVIITFTLNLIACGFTSYYLNNYITTNYIKSNWFESKQIISSYPSLISYLSPMITLILSLILHSYLYIIIALMLAPKGHDINSYSGTK